MAMPTGTRNNMSVNKAIKPIKATASGLKFIRSMSVSCSAGGGLQSLGVAQ